MSRGRVRYRFIDWQISKLFADNKDICNSPIQVQELARRLNVQILERDCQGEMDAAAIKNGDQRIIVLNKNQSLTRKRFSIAHELGHILLHSDPLNVDVEIYKRDENSAKGADTKEIEANFFAASLLMPESLIKKCIAEKNIKEIRNCDIELLSREFQVSSQSMNIRLQNMRLIKKNIVESDKLLAP